MSSYQNVLFSSQIQDPNIYNWFLRFTLSFVASYSIYLTSWNNLIRLSDQADFLFNNNGDTFDFIVIGSGSAGGVVSNRLSAKYRVLLLEAGGDPCPVQLIPSLALFSLNYPQIDWSHKTNPQKYAALAFDNRECFWFSVSETTGTFFVFNEMQSTWNQGRSLGGTSNINLLIESRGNPRDFDNWADITGDNSWSYKNVLPYFKKHEDFVGQWEYGDVHAKGGEARVEVSPYSKTVKLAEYFIDAGKELGYKHDDLNGRYTEGFDFTYSNMKNGRRFETFSAFIAPAMERKNLIISRFSHVNKIHFQGSSNEAYAVEYYRYGSRKFAYATKEIILSAGAIKSPQILQLSGIGPKDTLEKLGIPIKMELPVGKNVQDHLCTYLAPFFIDEPLSFHVGREIRGRAAAEFMSMGTGPLTNNGPSALAFIASSKAILESKLTGQRIWPDIQLYMVNYAANAEFPQQLSEIFGMRRDISEKYYKHAIGRDTFTVFVSNARPKARGYITLKTGNPYDPPEIEPNYLDNEHDLEVIVEGVKKVIELAENTTALGSIGSRFTEERFPGCEHVPFRSNAYWRCYIKNYSVSLHHITGSCSMGRADDPNSVVDTQLRVIGTKRLRVIDASVMPVIPVGNTHSPTTMIGEKGADLILRDWEYTLYRQNVLEYFSRQPKNRIFYHSNNSSRNLNVN